MTKKRRLVWDKESDFEGWTCSMCGWLLLNPFLSKPETLSQETQHAFGLLLTQMAKTLGARVTATVSTREKLSLSLEAGADEVLQYTEVDFAERIKDAG